MTSHNRQTGTYLHNDDTTDAGTDYEPAKQRHATVYDAVAGTFLSSLCSSLCSSYTKDPNH